MSGSCRGYVKFVSGSCWGHVRVMLGSFQGYFRSCWGYVRVMTGSFQLGIISFVKFTRRLETEGFSVLFFLLYDFLCLEVPQLSGPRSRRR